MSEPFIGQIILFAGTFAPRGWAFCQGQLLSIAQNTALYSIILTNYGGNGQTTFALPDLRGRYAMQPGQGPGLSPRVLGEQGGTETVTLNANQMPAHTHSFAATSDVGASTVPNGAFVAASSAYEEATRFGSVANTTMNPASIGIAGGSQPHNNMSPFLGVNYIIAMEGIYPSRN